LGVGAGLYMYDVAVKSSLSLSHLLMSSCPEIVVINTVVFKLRLHFLILHWR